MISACFHGNHALNLVSMDLSSLLVSLATTLDLSLSNEQSGIVISLVTNNFSFPSYQSISASLLLHPDNKDISNFLSCQMDTQRTAYKSYI